MRYGRVHTEISCISSAIKNALLFPGDGHNSVLELESGERRKRGRRRRSRRRRRRSKMKTIRKFC
jgi:hypothetical protein